MSDFLSFRVSKAPMEEKLPALYLMDSICKFAKPDNVRQVYIASFTRNVVKVFGNAYNMVSDEIQKRLERLMDTWRVQRVFPTHIIRSLESVIGQPSSGPAYPSYPGSQQQQAFNPNSAPQLPLLAPSVIITLFSSFSLFISVCSHTDISFHFGLQSAPNLAMLAQQVQAVLTYKRQMQMVNPNDAQTNAHINGLEAVCFLLVFFLLARRDAVDSRSFPLPAPCHDRFRPTAPSESSRSGANRESDTSNLRSHFPTRPSTTCRPFCDVTTNGSRPQLAADAWLRL